jgi:Bardet-Biedl syndrome 5 protein
VLIIQDWLPFVRRSEGESDIIEKESRPDAWAAYCADGAEAAGMGREPMYCQELGLAIETPRDGATVQQLWSIL